MFDLRTKESKPSGNSSEPVAQSQDTLPKAPQGNSAWLDRFEQMGKESATSLGRNLVLPSAKEFSQGALGEKPGTPGSWLQRFEQSTVDQVKRLSGAAAESQSSGSWLERMETRFGSSLNVPPPNVLQKQK